MLTHWSVAQPDSNDEKTGGRQSRWTVPLKILLQKIYVKLFGQVQCIKLCS